MTLQRSVSVSKLVHSFLLLFCWWWKEKQKSAVTHFPVRSHFACYYTVIVWKNYKGIKIDVFSSLNNTDEKQHVPATLTWPPHTLSWAETRCQSEAVVDHLRPLVVVKKSEKSAVSGRIKQSSHKSFSPPTSQVTLYVHVCPHSYNVCSEDWRTLTWNLPLYWPVTLKGLN